MFETLSTTTRTLFVFGLGASAVYNDGSNKIYGVVFIGNKKTKYNFRFMIQCFAHVSAILVIIMMTRRTKRSLIQAITIYVYIYIHIYEKMFAA